MTLAWPAHSLTCGKWPRLDQLTNSPVVNDLGLTSSLTRCHLIRITVKISKFNNKLYNLNSIDDRYSTKKLNFIRSRSIQVPQIYKHNSLVRPWCPVGPAWSPSFLCAGCHRTGPVRPSPSVPNYEGQNIQKKNLSFFHRLEKCTPIDVN